MLLLMYVLNEKNRFQKPVADVAIDLLNKKNQFQKPVVDLAIIMKLYLSWRLVQEEVMEGTGSPLSCKISRNTRVS